MSLQLHVHPQLAHPQLAHPQLVQNATKDKFAMSSLKSLALVDQASLDSPTLLLDQLPLTVQQFKYRTQLSTDSHRLWQINAGVVRTSTWTEEGVTIPLGFWSKGDVVGQDLSQVEPFQIECLTDVEVSLLRNSYDCSQRSLVAHIQQAEELLRIMHTRSMEKRLLQFLLWLVYKFGHINSAGGVIPFRLTHQDLAEAIGTTRVTITRLLSKLEREDVVLWSKQRQILLNFSTGFW